MKKVIGLLAVLMWICSVANASENVILNCADQDGLNYAFYADSNSPNIKVQMISSVLPTWFGKLNFDGKKVTASGIHEVFGIFFQVNNNGKGGMFFQFQNAKGDGLKVKSAQDLINATKDMKKGIESLQTFSIYAGSAVPNGDFITGSFATCYIH